jgi:integrase
VTTDVVRYAVKRYARRIGIDHLAPHDLRRICARLCQEAGGELEQAQFLLGHASVQTTENSRLKGSFFLGIQNQGIV